MFDLEGMISGVEAGEVETKLSIMFPNLGTKTYVFYISGKREDVLEHDRISFKNVNLPSKEFEAIKQTSSMKVEVYRIGKFMGFLPKKTVLYSSKY